MDDSKNSLTTTKSQRSQYLYIIYYKMNKYIYSVVLMKKVNSLLILNVYIFLSHLTPCRRKKRKIYEDALT